MVNQDHLNMLATAYTIKTKLKTKFWFKTEEEFSYVKRDSEVTSTFRLKFTTRFNLKISHPCLITVKEGKQMLNS